MGFSERTFEFCFNSEFCQRNSGLLAAYPYIPSQREEKDLGYDVEFKIKNNVYTRSTFLQHKIVSYAKQLAGTNARFFDEHGGPYFRFTIDNNQHNLLVTLNKREGNARYCAPRFHTRGELETHYRGNAILNKSVWLIPAVSITDTTRHNITFDPTGSPAFLHSEPHRLESVLTSNEQFIATLSRQRISEEYVEKLSIQLFNLISETRLVKRIPKESAEQRAIERTQYMLGHLFGVSWILLP